jgi:hypothetical protein
MKRDSFFKLAVSLVAVALCTAGGAWAGPGTIVIPTDPNLGIELRVGGQVRVIPVYESNWDLGLSEWAGIKGLGSHVNEAGILGRNYARTEDRLYLNVAGGDAWDFYMALEFDTVFTQRRTDRVSNQERGIFDDLGIERLNASVKVPWLSSRIHAGWDTGPSVDLDAGGMIYVDDDPGIWLVGKAGPLGWKLAYVLKNESQFVYSDRTNVVVGPCPPNINVPPEGGNVPTGCPQPLPIGAFDGNEGERRLATGRIDYTLTEGNTLSAIYVVNHSRVRGQPPAAGANAISSVTHYPGLLYLGKIGKFKPMLELAGSIGSVRYPGLQTEVRDYLGNPINGRTFNLRSFALYGDVAYDASEAAGFKLEPHVGFYYLKGDGNPGDDRLEGYTPAVSNTRFTPRFSGEHTIVLDSNIIYGSALYAPFPELWGNQGNLMTNGAGLFGNSRSDAPGVTLVGGGVDTEPVKGKLRYRANLFGMLYNQPFLVGAIGDPNNASNVGLLVRDTGAKRVVDSRLFGVEWDNEITYMFNSVVSAKLQVSFLFPGAAARQIAGALANRGSEEMVTLGGVDFERASHAEETRTIRRLGAELLWNF